RPKLRNHLDYPRKYLRSHARLLVVRSPIFLILRPGEVVEKLLLGEVRILFNQLNLVGSQSDLGHLRYESAYRVAETANRLVHVTEDIRQFQPIGIPERTFQHRLGYFEADEIVIRIRGISLLCNLHDIEAKLGLNV